jgi:hypothetical protein
VICFSINCILKIRKNLRYVREGNVKFSIILPAKHNIWGTIYHYIAPHVGGWGVEMRGSQRGKTKAE